ncbi:MAG: spore germination protein GerW family protein [Candidatus Cloacimonetes bacterium]|nr:spore germination protein GerW family protein [Candidatus Cloacimonadota bacterium]
MNLHDITSQIRKVIQEFAGAEIIFGNPVSIKDVTLISVTRAAFGFGGGGGSSPGKPNKKNKADSEPATEPLEDLPQEEADPKQKPQASFGGSGGGGLKLEPIGIFLIKNDRARFYPVISFKHIISLFGVLGFLIFRLARRK